MSASESWYSFAALLVQLLSTSPLFHSRFLHLTLLPSFCSIRIDQLLHIWSFILPNRMHKPPERCQCNHTCQNDRVVIHGCHRSRQRILYLSQHTSQLLAFSKQSELLTYRKAIEYIEEGNEERRDAVDGVPPFPQMERSHRHILPSRKHVGRKS